MKDDAHEAIKSRLASHGVTDPDHVGAALDAHEGGIDVQQILADIAAGVPQWLALLRQLRTQAQAGAGKKTAKPSAAKKAKE